mgnify:CR=1 FL=1
MNAEIPSSKAITPLRSGGKMASIVPQSFEEVQRLATMAVRAGIGSYGWRDTPEQCIAKATAAIMHGMELGLSPMQSLSGIAVINGKTTIYGDLLTAVLWANGFKIKKWIDGEGDERVARAKITRPDGEVIEAKFSVAQAKQARLWDTRETVQKKGRDGGQYMAPNDSAWFRFAEDMLEWKAVGRCVRAGASDATRGLMILEDMESLMIDVTPSAAAPAISNATDIPEIPEVPSVPTVPEETQVSPSDDPRLSPDQEQQFLEKLSDEIAIAGNSDAVQEVAEMYAGILDRMSDEGRRAAEKIIEGRG